MLLYMLKSDFEKMKKTLEIFIVLKKGDKLMKDGDQLYSEPAGFFQSFKRWWYDENQEKTIEYLDEYFKKFMEFLDRVLNKRIRYDFKKEICDFINLIIPGLYSLKLTYTDSKELCCKVDSIILTMLDFKSAVYKN